MFHRFDFDEILMVKTHGGFCDDDIGECEGEFIGIAPEGIHVHELRIGGDIKLVHEHGVVFHEDFADVNRFLQLGEHGSCGYARRSVVYAFGDGLIAEDEENIEGGVEDIVEVVIGDLDQSVFHREFIDLFDAQHARGER